MATIRKDSRSQKKKSSGRAAPVGSSNGGNKNVRAGVPKAAGAKRAAISKTSAVSATTVKAAAPKGAAASAGKPAKAAPQHTWNLRLYVAGDSPKSRTALENLRRLCDTHLGKDYHIEVVDLKTRPELAKADQILALPTLIRKVPEPMKRVIGDLSNAERALVGLDLGAKQV